MTPFDLLSEPVKKYIRDKRWEQLRPIQAAAISKIISTDSNYILASRTASGKTEAAFLPVLSKVNFGEPGVQVLYISPLIALINDQFYRIEELCKYLDVPIVKWHGEANVSVKKALLNDPRGIVLITPESIEAMFVNKPFNIPRLFGNLKYIVIDEVHSFIGTYRGVQLKSLLARLRNAIPGRPGIIGLSATIGDYQEAKKLTGDEINTVVLLDRTKKEIEVHFRYYEAEGVGLPLDLLKDLYLETKDDKVLVFPNSRGLTEEVAVKLKKISERVGGHSNYFSHHSSVDKEVREYVEYFAKNNDRKNFCIACTSTLELGIDIGSIDEVVQIDAAHSIASLIQRIGRSGRKDGKASKLFLYATNKWSLIQSVACWELYQEGFIEPPNNISRPYDILIHQLLSALKGASATSLRQLLQQFSVNYAFSVIDVIEIEEIIQHLIALDLIEKIDAELIIGVEGEKIVNNRDFYSVFISPPNFRVVYEGNNIGEIPLSTQTIVGENILLAARIWKIKFVDEQSKKIDVTKALDGKSPIFSGTAPYIHGSIREKMLKIIFSSFIPSYLNEESAFQLSTLRQDFSCFKMSSPEVCRPLLVTKKSLIFFTFSGTKVTNTLSLLLELAGIKNIVMQDTGAIELSASLDFFQSKWPHLADPIAIIDVHISTLLTDRPTLISFSKWGHLLPKKYQVELVKQQYYDLDAVSDFLGRVQLVIAMND